LTEIELQPAARVMGTVHVCSNIKLATDRYVCWICQSESRIGFSRQRRSYAYALLLARNLLIEAVEMDIHLRWQMAAVLDKFALLFSR